MLPWHGFTLFPNGDVKNCAVSGLTLGNIHQNLLPEILDNESSMQVRKDMQDNVRHARCTTCYRSEDLQPKSNFSNLISNRAWYMKVMKNHDLSVYQTRRFVRPQILDLRWRNTCNFACIYCGPDLSSRWASELNDDSHVIDDKVFASNKQFILDNLSDVKHIYLAGGEPLLIKDNEDLLQKLRKVNPDATIRINTNLSKISNRIFEMLVHDFKDVRWTISLDSIADSYEYIRWPGIWSEFVSHLRILRNHTNKIDFNMTWSLLNAYDIFEAIDWLQDQMGFPDSTLVIQPVFQPSWLFIKNLDSEILSHLEQEIKTRLDKAQSGIYRSSLQSMLSCLETPWTGDLYESKKQLEIINQRRNIDFPQSLNYLNSINI